MKKYTLYSWNVNGFRAVKNKNFDDWALSTKADAICLQETKISEDKLTPELMKLTSYKSYWSCAEKKGYSGVAVFSQTEPKNIQYGLGIRKFDNEGRTLILEYPEFVLINCYFPNGQMNEDRLKFKLAFYEAFLDVCLDFVKQKKRVVFCGDVNTAHKPIDLANPTKFEKYSGFLPIERAWIDKVIECDFIDTFRFFDERPEQYSWWDLRTGARAKNIGWRIDYFFAHKALKNYLVDAAISQKVMGSDHCPISLKLKFE